MNFGSISNGEEIYRTLCERSVNAWCIAKMMGHVHRLRLSWVEKMPLIGRGRPSAIAKSRKLKQNSQQSGGNWENTELAIDLDWKICWNTDVLCGQHCFGAVHCCWNISLWSQLLSANLLLRKACKLQPLGGSVKDSNDLGQLANWWWRRASKRLAKLRLFCDQQSILRCLTVSQP